MYVVMFSSCKKDIKHITNPSTTAGVLESSLGNQNNAKIRLNGNYSGISYDAARGYLVFQSDEIFRATINSLQEELKNFKFDKGQTQALLNLINTANGNGIGINFGNNKNKR